MRALKLSNPFRRDAARPSLKDRAAALKASAAKVIRRKPKPQTLTERIAEMAQYHEGFVPYPREAPTCLMAIEQAVRLEAERLLQPASDRARIGLGEQRRLGLAALVPEGQ